MARAKRGFKRRRRVKKIMERAEGFYSARRTTYRRATEAVDRSFVYEFRDRKVRKRHFRQLWVTRLSAAAQLNNISYSRLLSALTKAKINLNRKMLSELAIFDPKAFTHIVDQVRSLAPAI